MDPLTLDTTEKFRMLRAITELNIAHPDQYDRSMIAPLMSLVFGPNVIPILQPNEWAERIIPCFGDTTPGPRPADAGRPLKMTQKATGFVLTTSTRLLFTTTTKRLANGSQTMAFEYGAITGIRAVTVKNGVFATNHGWELDGPRRAVFGMPDWADTPAIVDFLQQRAAGRTIPLYSDIELAAWVTPGSPDDPPDDSGPFKHFPATPDFDANEG